MLELRRRERFLTLLELRLLEVAQVRVLHVQVLLRYGLYEWWLLLLLWLSFEVHLRVLVLLTHQVVCGLLLLELGFAWEVHEYGVALWEWHLLRLLLFSTFLFYHLRRYHVA